MGIFDRLTDSSLYTGAHKHRFDGDGNGRGLAGRDSISKGSGHVRGGAGGVADLSQICRTNLDHGGGTSILGSSRDTGGGTFYNSGMAPLRGVTPVSSAKPSLINDAAGSWRTPVPQRAGSASRPVRASADGGAAAARPPSAHRQSVPGISPSSPSERASYETNYMHSPGSSGRTTTTPVPSPSFINENAGSWRTPVPQRPLSAARPVRASADGAAGGTASSRQPVVQHVQPSFAPSTERLNFEKNYKSAEAARGGGGGNGGGNSIISPKQSLISNVAGSLINQNAGSWRGQVPSRPISASRPIRASADGGGFGTANTASFSQPVQRPTSAMRGVRASADGGSGAARSGGSIFDKLTDSSQYTGAHKQRFDGAGNGRGASGRTTGASNVNAADNCRRG